MLKQVVFDQLVDGNEYLVRSQPLVTNRRLLWHIVCYRDGGVDYPASFFDAKDCYVYAEASSDYIAEIYELPS